MNKYYVIGAMAFLFVLIGIMGYWGWFNYHTTKNELLTEKFAREQLENKLEQLEKNVEQFTKMTDRMTNLESTLNSFTKKTELMEKNLIQVKEFVSGNGYLGKIVSGILDGFLLSLEEVRPFGTRTFVEMAIRNLRHVIKDLELAVYGVSDPDKPPILIASSKSVGLSRISDLEKTVYGIVMAAPYKERISTDSALIIDVWRLKGEVYGIFSTASKSRIDTVESDISRLESDISRLESVVSGLYGLGGLKSNVSSLSDDISSVRIQVSSLQTDVSALKREVYGLLGFTFDSRIDKLEAVSHWHR